MDAIDLHVECHGHGLQLRAFRLRVGFLRAFFFFFFQKMQILGLDVLLDVHGNPHLLEVNSNPSLNVHHEAKDEHG